MWSWIACVPEETERMAVQVAAADLVADVMVRLTAENIDGGQVGGTDTYTFTASEEVTDPDWSGTLTTEVTWGGDPDGVCACRGDCASSRWTFSSTLDLRFRHDTSLTWCNTSSDAPDGDPPDLDLAGTLVGAGGLGPRAEDLECHTPWPTWEAQADLRVLGLTDHTYDLAVTITPDGHSDDVSVTLDGEVTTWTWSCGV